jgi:hypothetical protein
MASKEIKQLVRKLEQQGWRVELGGGGHYKAFPPDVTKPMVTFASTPSDHRALRNIISMLRRSGADL